MSSNPQKKICIVGGKGAMGQLFWQLFGTKLGYYLSIFDENDWHHNPQDKLQNQDLVLISVPIEHTTQTIIDVCQYITPETVLADITSIKSIPLQSMLKAHKGPVVGLHPIFGPTINCPKNQVIISCHGRKKQQYQWFLDDLLKLEFILKEMSAQAHDKAMTFIQGIEHFNTFCMGAFLKDNDIDLHTLKSIASPVYNMELNIIGRLFHQDPNLYANIIASDDHRIKMIQSYANFMQQQAQQLQDQASKIQFIKQFNDIKKWMSDFSETAYNESDALLGVKK